MMLGPCAICKRDLRGGIFGYSPDRLKPTWWACSRTCATLAEELYGMDDLMTEIEMEARSESAKAAGQYMDSIGKTDMSEMTREEWGEMWRRAFDTYHETLVLAAHRHAPF